MSEPWGPAHGLAEKPPVTLTAHEPLLAPSRLLRWTQSAAIFAVCVNLFSTALGNLGFLAFVVLFLCLLAPGQRRHLDTRNFPLAVAVTMGLYIAWQVVGLSYTEAPMPYALKSIFSERKMAYILPLVLVFSDGAPKRRFLIAFLAVSTLALVASSALVMIPLQAWVKLFSHQDPRWVSRVISENQFLLRSNVTQGMVFALCAFLALWFSLQQQKPAAVWGLRMLAAAFAINIATLTHGRSGYVVFLVLTVCAFAMRRGFRGVLVGLISTACLALFSFYALPSVHQRVMQGVTEAREFDTAGRETSLGIRVLLYGVTLELIRENPVLGLGTGGFKQRYSAIAAEKYSGWQSRPADDPHNQYLFILVENGVIGLLTFFALIFAILRHCLQSGSIYGKMAACCVLAWCATSLFSGHFRTFPEGHLIAFIVGILMVNRVPDGRLAGGAASAGGAA